MQLFQILVTLQVVFSRLIQVTQIFRHGARYPLHNYSNAEPQLAFNGQLLPAGMRQHYLLGQQLRKEYITDLKFLSSQYNFQEYLMISTDVDRTLVSAQSQLQGMYPDGPQLSSTVNQVAIPPYSGIQPENLTYALPHGYSPVPIHISRIFASSTCHKQKSLIQIDQKEIEQISDDFMKKTKDQFPILCKKFNHQNCTDFEDIYGLQDVYTSYIMQGLWVPEYTQAEKELFDAITSFSFYRRIGGYQQSRFMTKEFFQKLLKTFNEKVANTSSGYKWISYSAHDNNIAQLAYFFGLTSAECIYNKFMKKSFKQPCLSVPPFASNIIIELHHEQDEGFYVMLKYNGEYQNFCYNKNKCSLEDFKLFVLTHIPSDVQYKVTCQDGIILNSPDNKINHISDLINFSSTLVKTFLVLLMIDL